MYSVPVSVLSGSGSMWRSIRERTGLSVHFDKRRRLFLNPEMFVLNLFVSLGKFHVHKSKWTEQNHGFSSLEWNMNISLKHYPDLKIKR